MSALVGLLGGQGIGFAKLQAGGGGPSLTAYDDLVDATSPDRHLKLEDTGSVVSDRKSTDTGSFFNTVDRGLDPLVEDDVGRASVGVNGDGYFTFPNFLTGLDDASRAIDLALQVSDLPSNIVPGQTKYVIATSGDVGVGAESLEIQEDGVGGLWVRCWIRHSTGYAVYLSPAGSVPIGDVFKLSRRVNADGSQDVLINAAVQSLSLEAGATANADGAPTAVPAATWYFGRWPSGTSPFYGRIDEVVGWGRPAATTYDVMVQNLTPIAYWKGFENTTAWVDQQGVQNGTIANGPLVLADTIVDSDAAGQAAAFNGVDQWISIAHNATLKPASGALILTAQLRLLAQKATLFQGDANAAAGGIGVEITTAGAVFVYLRDSGGTVRSVQSPDDTISLEKAYSYGVTWGASGLNAYVWDDAEILIWNDSVTSPEGGFGLAGTSDFRIGAWFTGISLADGIISRVALFGTQLSQAQLATVALPKTLAGGALPTPPSPPA